MCGVCRSLKVQIIDCVRRGKILNVWCVIRGKIFNKSRSDY